MKSESRKRAKEIKERKGEKKKKKQEAGEWGDGLYANEFGKADWRVSVQERWRVMECVGWNPILHFRLWYHGVVPST